jgi:branched-chain amino acid transport system substrate-binding protein
MSRWHPRQATGAMSARRHAPPVIALIVLLGALALAAQAGAGGAGLPKTIKIGVLTSLTGPSGSSCSPESLAVRLAANRANKQRFFGKNTFVKLTIVDDKSTQDGVIAGYRDLVSQGVAAIIGPCLSTNAETVAVQSDSSKMPEIVNLVSDVAPIQHKYVFRGTTPQTIFAQNTIKVLAAKGVKTVAVVHTTDNPDLVTIWDSWKAQFKKRGIKVLADYGIQGRPPDISALVAQIAQLKPDAIGLDTLGAATAGYANQLRQAGQNQLVFGQIVMAYPFYYGSAPANAGEGSLYATNFDTSIDNKYIKAFTNGWHDENNGSDPSPSAAQGYDGAWRLWRALKSANSVNHDAVRTALEQQKTGVQVGGPVTFTHKGHEVVGTGYVVLAKGNVRTVQKVPK